MNNYKVNEPEPAISDIIKQPPYMGRVKIS